MTVEWSFRRMAKSEINQDPVQDEFFAPEEGYAAALVRESLQNSLDAAANGSAPVRVRFGFVESNHDLGHSLYSGLKPHLIAQELEALPEWHVPIRYLNVEDFGTRGLNGDPLQADDQAADEIQDRNDFYYFWRNIGRSEKQEGDRGRWGLGKTVFPGSSRINSFFGLTRRADDGAALLLGQSVGRIHVLAGDKYAFYGYFGQPDADGFVHPVQDSNDIHGFSSLVGLSRTNEPGLSVVIPHPWDEIAPDDIAIEVIRSYYLPILRGQLIVDIADYAGQERRITDETIVAVLDSLPIDNAERAKLSSLLAFSSEVLAFPQAELINLPVTGESGAADWSNIMAMVQQQEDVRTHFDQGNIVGFRVRVVVDSTSRGKQQSDYRVFLHRVESASDTFAEFVRQGLSVSQAGRAPTANVRGIVIVDSGPLATLLGDSENPAHTKWQERSKKVRSRYTRGASTVRFTSRTLWALSSALSQPQEGLERDLLSTIFFVSDPLSEVRQLDEAQSNEEENVETDETKVPPIPRTPSPIRIGRLQGGFAVLHNEDEPTPGRIRVRVAYAVRRGNPFSRYMPEDFRLGADPIELDVAGCSYETRDNELLLRPTEPGFSVSVIGFDPHRDVIVDARTDVTDEAAA